MPIEKIKTINGEELMNLVLPPLRFAVDGLLPQGVCILAGRAKTGKSWLVLSLCIAVAEGKPFWGRETQKSDVLYLCLEDSRSRLQQRVLTFTEEPPKNLYFAEMAHSLEDGLAEQIRWFLDEHPDTRLVVIDTLQKVRMLRNDNLYAQDYKDIGLLKAVADRYGVCILCVHHLRKMKADDPHDMVSGSTGLIGAADASFVLIREKSIPSEARLHIRGRDIEEQVLQLRFDRESCLWECISGNTPEGNSLDSDADMQTLLTCLEEKGELRGTASELVSLCGLSCRNNILTKKLLRYERELQGRGVSFLRTRNGQRRELWLDYTSPPADDGMTV